MEARLAAIAAEGGDQKEKTQKYQTVLTESLSNGGDVEGLKQMVVHMLSDVVPLVTSRQILSTLCSEAKSLPAAQHKDVAEFALEKITPRVVSFEEQVSVLREGLAKLLKDDGKASEAASMLAGIDLDSGIRNLSDEYKLRMCMDIAMLYLEDDDATNADAFIKKASFLLGACKVRLGRTALSNESTRGVFATRRRPMIIPALNHTEGHGPHLAVEPSRRGLSGYSETRRATEAGEPSG